MRVAVVTTPDLSIPSGSTLYAVDLVRSLAAEGVDVTAVVADPGPLREVPVRRAPIPIPHPIEEDVELPPQRYSESVDAIARTLLELHEDEPLDVVHGLYSTFTGYACCLFQLLTGVPAVVSCLGRDVNPGTHQHPAGKRLTRATVAQARSLVASNE